MDNDFLGDIRTVHISQLIFLNANISSHIMCMLAAPS